MLLHDKVQIHNEIHNEGMSILNVKKTAFCDDCFTILLLYRNCDSSYENFCNMLFNITSNEEIDIVMGDFNINALDSKIAQINAILRDFHHIVKRLTHLLGALLDHVYVKNSILENYDIEHKITK